MRNIAAKNVAENLKINNYMINTVYPPPLSIHTCMYMYHTHTHVHIVQWNLHNTDTTGTLSNCPYYRGVLTSGVVQATPLNQRGSPASLKLLGQQKKAQRRPGREFYLAIWRFSLVNQSSS